MTRTAADLNEGEGARVTGIEGQDAIATRLLEMGLIPGADIRLVGRAPWGDPLELEVRGYRLSLRRGEAERVVLGDEAPGESDSDPHGGRSNPEDRDPS